MAKKQAKKVRGIYEKIPGLGVWWIRYSDATGRIRREKAGLKQTALTLYRKRKTEVLQGKKLPETRRRTVSFKELTQDALDYSKANKRSHDDDVCRIGKLRDWFGERSAENVNPQDIERFLEAGMKDDKRNRLRQTAIGPSCRWRTALAYAMERSAQTRPGWFGIAWKTMLVCAG